VAGTDLIAVYLAELRCDLRRRRDVEDVVAEVEDHLREVAAWHVERGMDPSTAQRHALGQFGTSTLVARAFEQQDRGRGIAMPTSSTRRSGLLWLLAALLLAPGVVLVLHDSWRSWDVGVFWQGAVLVGAGLTTLLGAMVATRRRHGGSTGRRGTIALVLVALSVPPGLLLTWFTPIWMTLATAGCVLFALALHEAGVLPRPAVALFGVGAVIVTGAMWAGGPLEAASDRFLWGLPGLLGGVVFTLGCAWLGYALWSEQPRDVGAGLTVS
jgi:hypothetical protein